ncbi:hypothetical protein JC794_11430 [Morganella morganii]|uniref:hypothetical protein n=1 Tax=Morganella morganii TaxID=582 RepID=UPI0011B4D7D6|nr:hypothetical protein [Morganella morganii]QXO41212.1 hypothetical protein CXB74_010945 [Morganella morganii]QXO44907.1 hypothetical protein JC862_10795 [Morganella morganii]QXO48403.1 hypothetical protein JC861_10885 [Morganella morganii]QXO52267.1 hypothetical protein JC830_10885 [Morganella morganii]QXO56184.1 hypothetical protein JC827_11425 [Morganella morganii]
MKIISHAPEYQPLRAGSCTQNQPVFSYLKDNLASVINSFKTFSTGCHTQKDHNIRKVCERLIALTCMTPECYLTPVIKACAQELGFVLPGQTEPVAAENGQATASIGKLSVLSTSSVPAQAAYNMLKKQQDKYLSSESGFSQKSADTIQMVLEMAEQGFCLARDHSSRYEDKYIVTAKPAENTQNKEICITPEKLEILHSAAYRMNHTLTRQLITAHYKNESIRSNTGGSALSGQNFSNLSHQIFYPDFNNISIAA